MSQVAKTVGVHGLDIIARSMSAVAIPDKFGNTWQYHSQSDRHSRIACWATMFDILRHCPLLCQHAALGKIGFGINHKMRDFQTSREKALDLVVCTPRLAAGSSAVTNRASPTFASIAGECDVLLTSEQGRDLEALPGIPVVPVGSVAIALEAKAAMTAHQKALPRLHDELDSSHLTIHGDTDSAIAAALITVNIADRFLSTSRNKHFVKEDTAMWSFDPQPERAASTIAKMRQIRRRSKPGMQGFDAMGIVLIEFRNDGSPCVIWDTPPAPTAGDSDNYSNMIERIASQYASKFSAL